MIKENLAKHSPTEYQTGEIVLLKADAVSKRGKLIIININNRIERPNLRFYNLLTAPRTVSKTHALAARAQSSANHVQHIEQHMCHVERRDSSAINFVFSFILLAEAINR